jgi:ribosome assembly protein 1
MNEPMHGVGFIVDRIEVTQAVLLGAVPSSMSAAALAEVITLSDCPYASGGGGSGSTSADIQSGQLIAETKDMLRLAFLTCPVRVVEPIYKCSLQCQQSQLGNLYAVLSKRRGEVFQEDVIEGTDLFILDAHLPVGSSFGFAQELLKKTSGLGTAPQLMFSHWRTHELDPFWRPISEEEREEYGDTGIFAEPNLPRICIDTARKRKGLAIEEKVVVSAEKQRTMKKRT